MKHKYTRLLIPALIIGMSAALVIGFTPVYMEWSGNQPKTTSPVDPTPSPTPTITLTPTPTPALTVSQIIDWSYHPDTLDKKLEKLPQNQVHQLALGGDVMLGRAVGFNMIRNQDFTYPVKYIASFFRQADMAIVNLENPIINDCPLTTEGMIFCSSPGTRQTLTHMGIDVTNLANNHMLNYGAAGLEQTITLLIETDIQPTGLRGRAAIHTLNDGTKIGVLGYTYSAKGTNSLLNPINIPNIESDISKLKPQVDFVIVSFHWGNEYQIVPAVSQRAIAYQTVDAGADLVFGHHPHWVQGFEVYKDVPIYYSLGNLVFDQNWSQETREGLALEIFLYQNQIAGVRMKPVFMEEFAQPSWQPVGQGNLILGKIEKVSDQLQATQIK